MVSRPILSYHELQLQVGEARVSFYYNPFPQTIVPQHPPYTHTHGEEMDSSLSFVFSGL